MSLRRNVKALRFLVIIYRQLLIAASPFFSRLSALERMKTRRRARARNVDACEGGAAGGKGLAQVAQTRMHLNASHRSYHKHLCLNYESGGDEQMAIECANIKKNPTTKRKVFGVVVGVVS